MARSRLGILLLALVMAILPLRTQAGPKGPLYDALADIPPGVRLKIDPALLKQFLEASERGAHGKDPASSAVTFLVHLHDGTSVADLQHVPGALARRQLLVQRLRERAINAQRHTKALLEERRRAGRVQQYRSYWIFNGLAVTSDLQTALEIAQRPEVAALRPNRTHHLPAPEATLQSSPLPWGLSTIGAERVWSELGVTGEGVVVANIDSGVDWTHPALQHSYRGYNPANPAASSHDYAWFDATGTYPDAPGPQVAGISLYSSHGTHTMGTMVGSLPDGSLTIGVAPGAQWIALKVFDDFGQTTDAWIHAGFEWCLAPTDLAGLNPDPSKAPDIVNASWGEIGMDTTFSADVAALRAAGILTFFAAGNNGPSTGTINSPGSLSHAFAVGATNSADEIASFSARGPSPWGEIKPNLVAPGVGILSSVAGGDFQSNWQGTSMATPHASGVAALLWSADRAISQAASPTLTVTRTEEILTSTAVDLGPAGADNAYGWGRVDAFAAVASLVRGGTVLGQVDDAFSGDPIPGANVALRNQASGAQTQVLSAEDGSFALDLEQGTYDLRASRFGYEDGIVHDITVTARETITTQVALQPLALGVVQGRVTVAETGQGAPATVSAGGTPASATVDALGYYTLTLPIGTYALRAQPDASGYRGSVVADVQVREDAWTQQDLSLTLAPRILLVDADAWLGASVAAYYTSALEALLYGYAVHTIEAPVTDLPTIGELAAYDLIVWAQPDTSPGYIGAWSSLSGYLDGGGRLLLSGQSIGYWDDYWGRGADYYRGYLRVQYVGTDAGLEPLVGLEGEVLHGITLTYNTEDSAKNQTSPDLVAPLSLFARPIVGPAADRTCGVTVDTTSYRLVYLSFGLEGVGPASARAETLDRLLAAALSQLLITDSVYLPSIGH